MIQRIQSLWLLVAMIFQVLTFAFSLYQSPNVLEYPNFYVGESVLGIILTSVTILATFYTLILFKNRKKQMNFAWISIIAALGTFAYLYIACEGYLAQYNFNGGHYWLGLFMPLVSVVFLFMAISGIRKDQKLVKSLDRLR